MVARIAPLPQHDAEEFSAHGAAYMPTDERCAPLIDALPHAAVVLRFMDGRPRAVMFNDRFKALWNAHRHQLEGRVNDLLDAATPRLWEVATGQIEKYEVDQSFTGPLGERKYRGCASRIRCEPGEPPMILYMAVDHTDDSRIEQVLRRELLTDPLTALPNRAGFLDIAEAKDQDLMRPRAMLFLDLVRFSRINESLGSIAGDEIIITVARRIKSILRSGDTLARVGGNEFAIYSASIQDPDVAERVAERARNALATPIRIGAYTINVEASIGCALGTPQEVDAEELFRRAQAAVKRAKRSGHFEVHRKNALVEAQQRFLIESRLREALENERLHLEFQPFVSLRTGRVEGFEALARWHDEELGRVSPAQFIPVAEESGLIVQLGRWALRQSAHTLAAWDRTLGYEAPVTMNVNLSPVQISRDDVSDAVSSALRVAGIMGDRITVEITESALITDVAKTRELLDDLKSMRISIAMDDFGTGFSNLANLQLLPIDVLKIDRSFVTDMVGDQDKVAVVRAILSLARALGMKTVAEGVETEEVSRALAELGYDRGQGYFYAKPLLPDEALSYLLERNALATT